MPFVTCLNTSTIQPAGLLDKIRLAGQCGFAAIELWLDDIEVWLDQRGKLATLRRALADAGLTVPSTIALKGWGDATDEAYPSVLDNMKRRMDLAAEISSQFIVATPPRGPADLARVGRRYGDLLELGRQRGVRPAMEYLGFCESIFRPDQAWRIVEDAQDPQATMVLDSFHTFRGGASTLDLAPITAERIAIYHLNDAPADPPRSEQTDASRVMPGDGVLDLASELTLLADKGYRGPVSLELFNRSLWEQSPESIVMLGIERMRALWDQVNLQIARRNSP